jgi:hypothetical protein
MGTTNPYRRGIADSAAHWVRSTRCGPDGGDCVEVKLGHADEVCLRDSAQARMAMAEILTFGKRAWSGFLTATRAGDYDR